MALILKDPIGWAENQAEKLIKQNQDKYLQAKQLGEEFWDGIRS